MKNNVKASPADVLVSTNPATDADSTPEITSNPDATATTPATAAPDAPATLDAAQIDPATGLPAGYLADGSLLETSDGTRPYVKQEYVGIYAQQIAVIFAPTLKASAFNKAFVAPAKKALARGTSYGEQMSTVAAMTPAAIKLTAKGKTPAPPILRDLIARTSATVTDSVTFDALYRHFDAIYSYMLLAEQQQKAGGGL